MKQEEIKFSKTIENLYCNYEKLRIFIRLARLVPNKRDMINRTKKHIRIHLAEFLDNEILFGGNEEKGNELLLDIARKKSGINTENRLAGDSSTRFLVVSHELSRTGAPRAALMLAQTLKHSTGGDVCLLSLRDGPMRDEFEAAGICVLVLEDMPYRRPFFLKFVHDFSMVCVCSVAWDFLRIICDVKIPVVWWVHEIIKNPVELQKIEEFINHIDILLTGSPLVPATFSGNLTPREMQMLLYGLPLLPPPSCEIKSEQITFALLGSVCERKGTDIFVWAIEMLPDDLRKKARFVVVGDNDDDVIYKKLMQAADKYTEIEIHNNMPFDELINAYGHFDVIVSASRADPMPIVLTYAFMFSQLCLCSDAAGTALLIEDGESGLLFQNEIPADLAAKMCYIIENWSTCELIAKNGNEIYKNHFSMASFNENVSNVTNRLVGSK